ncbi:DUF5667 domain-containing protein [Modestobacter sp. Leaf380]|uniref:DUF5667 domain-containing protein n=1 Tax=Modestobacter sp. Leaf380 TaxID=1736356 RepID=UPI0006FBE627|nr:DUF5667 domain-containing protein [Modestobacter sp. Leaf380]KQS73613.1 hypothetical protein ASG41_03045 [Modestobacter sp. Leaf380]
MDAPSGAVLEDALAARLTLLGQHAPTLDDDVRARQRARLVAMAAVRTPEPTPSLAQRLLSGRAVDTPAARWRSRLTAGLTGAALTVATLSGLVALAQGSEPGDLLYDVKRGTEQTQLALASDTDRGLTLLGFASTRLTELEQLTGVEAGALAVPVAAPVAPTADGSDAVLAADGTDVGTVRDVLATMDQQTTEGTDSLTGTIVAAGDPAPLATLDGWTVAQREGIAAVEAALPAEARPDAAASLALVDRVAARSAALQTGFACPGGLQTAGSDELGPVPAPCATPTDPSGTSTPSATPMPSTPATAAPTTGAPASETAPAPAGGGAAPTGTAGPGGGVGGGGGGGGGAPAPTGGAAPSPTAAVPSPAPAPVVPTVVPTAPPSTGGALVEVPPLVPGVQVCAPPLITVGC